MEADGWDLQAVVRGCCFSEPAMRDPFSSFPPLLFEEEFVDGEQDLLMSFPDLMATNEAIHELEELCKPFFLKPQTPPENQRQLPGTPSSGRQPSRSKRRRNQQKRLVCQVPVEGNPADQWAWRKYGQKPIKGSPYPRGYYRCSSSKGCLARKQVERSQTDPGMLVITYTAEHNHPVPTHRNSLAGTTRHKFPAPAASTAATNAAALSPNTPLKSSIGEEEEEDTSVVDGVEGMANENMMFVGFEDLEGPLNGAMEDTDVSGFFFHGDGGRPESFKFPGDG